MSDMLYVTRGLMPTIMGSQLIAAPASFISDAVVAYSFRKLRSSYSGSAVRIRRESDNAEADIGFDGNGDFDTAAAASHIGGSIGRITKWYDQIGSVDIFNTSSAGQPTYFASAIGGMPGLHYDGASGDFPPDKIWSDGGTELTWPGASEAATAAAVFSVDNLTNAVNGNILSILDPASAAGEYGSISNFSWQINSGATSMVATRNNAQQGAKAISASTDYAGAVVYTGSNVTCYLNNSAGTTDANTDGPFCAHGGTCDIHGGQRIGGACWEGYCTEMILWASNKTSSLTAIYTDQATYYGI